MSGAGARGGADLVAPGVDDVDVRGAGDAAMGGGTVAPGDTAAHDGVGLTRVGAGTWRSASVADTQALGERLGGLLGEGDVLVLTGDLGAGKTQLTKGIARGLGVRDDVTSPTFTIEMVHEGARTRLHHVDLYRLDDAAQLEDTGLFDVLGYDGVCVIEWGERFADELGDDRLDVCVTRLDDEAAPGEEPPRLVRLVARGTRAEKIVAAM